jgi:hypothetical protein
MELEKNTADFWLGALLGTGVGVLGYWMLTNASAQAAVPAVATSPSTHSLSLAGTDFSSAGKIGDTWVLAPAVSTTGTNPTFTSATASPAGVLTQQGTTGATATFVATAAGTVTVTATDSTGNTTNLTLVVTAT